MKVSKESIYSDLNIILDSVEESIKEQKDIAMQAYNALNRLGEGQDETALAAVGDVAVKFLKEAGSCSNRLLQLVGIRARVFEAYLKGSGEKEKEVLSEEDKKALLDGKN